MKLKLRFSGTSQVPGAAGNTVRIFLLIRKKKKKKIQIKTVGQQ